MKQFFILLYSVLVALSVNAQTTTFVLVDVSKSVKQTDLVNAKQALLEVLNGTDLSNGAYVRGGVPQGIKQFKLNTGDKLSISKFGDQQTTLLIDPQLVTISNSTDIDKAMSAFPTTPTDNNTYWKLAKAKVANYAVGIGLKHYRLFIVSDAIDDNFGHNGQPNYENSSIRRLVDLYNTDSNRVNEGTSFLVNVRTNTQQFKLNLISDVDVTQTKIIIIDTTKKDTTKIILPPRIALLSPAKPQIGKQTELKSESVNVNWSCNNCPEGIRYTVTVSGVGGTKYHETKKDLTANTVIFKLPDGKFRITVSSSNYTAESDYTSISVSTGGSVGIIALLILLGAAGIGYYLWDKSRKKKLDVFADNKQHDEFNQGPKRGPAPNSPTNDIF